MSNSHRQAHSWATVSMKGFIIAIMVPPLIHTAIITAFRVPRRSRAQRSAALFVIDQRVK